MIYVAAILIRTTTTGVYNFRNHLQSAAFLTCKYEITSNSLNAKKAHGQTNAVHEWLNHQLKKMFSQLLLFTFH